MAHGGFQNPTSPFGSAFTEEQQRRRAGRGGFPFGASPTFRPRPTASEPGPRRDVAPVTSPTGFRTPSDFPGGASTEPGAQFLRDIGAEFLIPFLQQQQVRGDILFGDVRRSLETDPGIAAERFATSATEAFTEDISRPGGAISGQIEQALGGTSRRGVGPSSGVFASGRQRISDEASRAVGNFFAQNIGQLRGQGIQREAGLLQFAQNADEMLANLIGSIFSVGASAEQLGLQRFSIRRQT